jgi:hypothetical protein
MGLCSTMGSTGYNCQLCSIMGSTGYNCQLWPDPKQRLACVAVGFWRPSLGGGNEAGEGKRRNLAYREVRRGLLEGGELRDDDRVFLEQECTAILVQDELLVKRGGRVTYPSGQPRIFPSHTANGKDGKPGGEASLRYCRKGFQAGLYIANVECRDSRLICKIFVGQCPPLSPFP